MRVVDVGTLTMKAWSSGNSDATPLAGPGSQPAFDSLMHSLTAMRAVAMHLEEASYDAADCALVRRALSAGYRPSQLATAIRGTMLDSWWSTQRPPLKRVLANLDTLIAAGTRAPTMSKDDAAGDYLAARAELEALDPWAARELPAFDPGLKPPSQIRAATEELRKLIDAATPSSKRVGGDR